MHVESQISRPKMSDDVPFLSTLGQNHDLGEFPMWCRFLQEIVSTIPNVIINGCDSNHQNMAGLPGSTLVKFVLTS
jgi:hypothetical protein